jgi:hypothetical protein
MEGPAHQIPLRRPRIWRNPVEAEHRGQRRRRHGPQAVRAPSGHRRCERASTAHPRASLPADVRVVVRGEELFDEGSAARAERFRRRFPDLVGDSRRCSPRATRTWTNSAPVRLDGSRSWRSTRSPTWKRLDLRWFRRSERHTSRSRSPANSTMGSSDSDLPFTNNEPTHTMEQIPARR